jgi:hypothetical protein
MRFSKSSSILPNALLHGTQLGTCHLYWFLGEESEYQDSGKTWSQSLSTGSLRQ